jgi:hypothetical protein
MHMATKKSAHSFHNKKELKKELASKIETALPEIEESLGKKKFNKRLKKATRLLVKGVHLNGADKKIKAPKKTQPLKTKEVLKKKPGEEKSAANNS